MDYNEVEAKIKDILICRLNLPIKPEEINSDTQIFGPGESSLGLDSVDGLEIVVGLSNEFGVTITEEEGPVIFQNIGTLTNYILEKTQNEN